MRFKIKRSTVIASLIAVQLSLLFFAVWTLNTRSAYFYTAVNVINIVVVLLIVYGRDHPAYKLTWTIVILAVPVFGILIYFIAGTHYLSHGIRKRLETSQKFNKEYVRQDPKALQRLCDGNPGCARQARYILSSCGRPVYEEGDARLLTPGENMLEALLEEVSKAERYIFLEFFIISQGTMWDQLFALLREKAAAGVEVRIIYDDVGTLDHMSRGFKKVVRAAGIRICTFNPFLPVPSKFMNYRDHRKIAVIDGTAAITGGINIGDEYINVIRPHGHWKDASILLRGGAAESLTVMFLEMWHLITGEELECGRYTCGEHTCGERTCGERTCGDHTCDERACGGQPDSKPGFVQPGFVQPYDDCPVDYEYVSESVYIQLINSALRYVYITTPYLIIDNEMYTALCLAAKSGVDVRIITPHIPDKWYVHKVTRSNYRRLLQSGVKIYEYMPGFIHSKTCVCDDETGIVGSVNFDYRSFYQQFECAVWLCKCGVLSDMKADFFETLEVSQQIDPVKWAKRRLPGRVMEIVLQLFAPMM